MICQDLPKEGAPKEGMPFLKEPLYSVDSRIEEEDVTFVILSSLVRNCA